MFTNILPDPIHTINTAGQASPSGEPGQGFSTVAMKLTMPIANSKSIGGRNIIRTKSKPLWEMAITYNPMTYAQFSPVYNFLREKRGSRKPFYVMLPQYKKSKNGTFADWTELNPGLTSVAGVHDVGSSIVSLTNSLWQVDDLSEGVPAIGDIFTITDSGDSLHTQAYMVCHVDTKDLWEGTQPSGSIRVRITPPLQRRTDTSSVAKFLNPLFKVTQKGDVQEYSLDNDNLYSFSLQLEEALY